MTSQGVVYVDEDTGSYRNLRLPGNWTVHREPEWLSLQGSMTWAFETFPDATTYGWLADDTRPRTPGWDKLLEAAAGDWCLSYARDLWRSEDPFTLDEFASGRNLSAGLCWGGNLVRAVGWWALPGVTQAGIDTAWTDLVRPLNLHRYRHDVVVEHWNWRSGKRPQDEVDSWSRDGDDYIERDLTVKNEWAWSHRYRDTLTLIAEAMRLGKTSPPLVYALVQSEVDEKFRTGGTVKQHDITRLHELERASRDYLSLHPNPEQASLDP